MTAGPFGKAGPFRIAQADTADDVAAAIGLIRAYAASLPIDLAYQNFEAEMAAMPGDYAPPRGAMLLARDRHDGATGCVGLRPLGGEDCEMKRLYIRPAARGSGLGRLLVEGVIAAAERIGYGSMWLDTLPSMTGAIVLYRRFGFEPVAPYYETPVAGTLFMRRALRGGDTPSDRADLSR